MEQVVQSFVFGRAERGALPLLPSQRVQPRIVRLAPAREYRFQQREWSQGNVNSAICTWAVRHRTRRSQRKRVSRTLRMTTSTGLAAAMMLVGRAAGRPVEVIDDIGTFRRAMPLFPATNATTSVSTRSR
ncbi:hypothetical protein PsorP6_000968 [Peronosclerospora sorghi]|uniref:Uncharacterized protein n=1 Tax=Peronosclerospora sorghi TaxID=230839 RepID=A0ACC0WQN4_9STRA|nr:hypothetical protein PsorP6_000968 [Peronosclerospora sorghi]